MRIIKLSLSFLLLLCQLFIFKIDLLNGFHTGNGKKYFYYNYGQFINLPNFSIHNKNIYKGKYIYHGKRSEILKANENVSPSPVKDNTTNNNMIGKKEKQKSEINNILKESENVTMGRSFSFNMDMLSIKPELLKELITQKYRKMFERHDKDCGSSEIQIIILTFKIYFLTEHMKKNKKDFACLRGLFKCVSKRRKLLVYLGRKNRELFNKITDYFKIKKPLLPRTAEYYSKDLKYIHFNNTKRFKNNSEKKKKDKTKNKKVQTDKIIFGN
ncbi:apicoplast ribosomal protein S15 precursor, putative [Plasmodium yoelii]|uniref:Ribosomal protein S15 n=3 Tax=Plasmodium yoelii TaxID=5861 RepID=A0AAE9WVZ9_PLAYO|nr:apicoplast ribosomal protein S15 precursor, putative [Plasmodium yoelii]WBY57589.1 ribosomal protein S15 [Plasmodium yoelii yoelii]CDU18200.1 apicoplast ribosomal protein S15 precursor, putative [Plasmodium yoelii]VTZ78617.1 apicoplast ribosomal protein S15 precursor, putative [Plasmodium yoelii]|eukprot:XP_022812283.1 apicoplast ribosomal protein S15 precursor, putative [Plasmodium yoelii]